jgi:site-specific DNA-cytosine methylase
MLVSILIVLLILVVILLAVIRQKDFVIENVPKLTVTSPAFKASGFRLITLEMERIVLQNCIFLS